MRLSRLVPAELAMAALACWLLEVDDVGDGLGGRWEPEGPPYRSAYVGRLADMGLGWEAREKRRRAGRQPERPTVERYQGLPTLE